MSDNNYKDGIIKSCWNGRSKTSTHAKFPYRPFKKRGQFPFVARETICKLKTAACLDTLYPDIPARLMINLFRKAADE